MAENLNLVWENTPDTPITAQNLSKSIDKYSDDDRIIFYDSKDQVLKLKANSKATINIPVTNAFFNFESTMTSHNGKFIPVVEENINYRYESTVLNSRSLALESGTINYVLNSSFESGLTAWNSVVSGTSSVSFTNTDYLYGTQCARMIIDNLGSIATLFQTITLANNTDSASLSFYYKSTSELTLNLIGNPNGIPLYWRSYGSLPYIWEQQQVNGTIIIPSSNGEWKRYEIPKIITGSITSLEIQIKFSSTVIGSTYYIDAVQLEQKNFCSSFTTSTRNTTKISYPNNILSTSEGSIDLIAEVKYLNPAGINTLFVVPTTSNDAIKLIYDSTSGNQLKFSLYNTDTSSYIEAAINLTTTDIFLNRFMHIICNWKSTTGISIYMKYVGGTEDMLVSTNNISFIPYSLSDTLGFHLGARHSGSNTTEILEGIIDKIKINNYISSNTDINNNIVSFVLPDNNIYRLYENTNSDMKLDPSQLDIGSSFASNTNYYVWACELSNEECEIVLSANNIRPLNRNPNRSRILGGFRTDGSGLVLTSTIWDIVSKYKYLFIEDFVTYNPNTNTITSEIKNSPSATTITANSPITTTTNAPIIANGTVTVNGVSTFNGNIQVNSQIITDQVKISDNKIEGNNSNIIVTNTGAYNVSINSSTGTGRVYLDSFNVKGNIISVEAEYNFVISTPTGSSSKIILNANSGNNYIDMQSNVALVDNKSLYFNDYNRQFINLGTTYASGGFGKQTDTLYINTPKNLAIYSNTTAHNSTKNNACGGQFLALFTNDEAAAGLVDVNSRLYVGKVHNAVYNDLAECWVRDLDFEIKYNMVAVQTTYGIRPSQKRAEKGSIGIVSNSYGFLLNDKDFKEDLSKSLKAPICIAGRVKVEIANKKIEIGDEVVSYKNGMAIKASWFEKIFKRDRILGQIDSKSDDGLYWIMKK